MDCFGGWLDESIVSSRMDAGFLQENGDKIDISRLQELKIPSLCDNCVNCRLCATQKKACAEFTMYVESIPKGKTKEVDPKIAVELLKDGSQRVPTKAVYRQHFPNDVL